MNSSCDQSTEARRVCWRRTAVRAPPVSSRKRAGAGLDLQGITSGPLWDRALQNLPGRDGEQHHRLRRLVSKAFAPRGAARLQSLIVDAITELVDPLTKTGRCDVVTDIARQYPTPIICSTPTSRT